MTQQTYSPPDPSEVLMGGGDGAAAPPLRVGPETFERPAHSQPGEYKGGRIVSVRPVQATKMSDKPDPATGQRVRVPQFYQSGKKAGQPIWDLHVDVQTDERDPQIEGDDGVRRIYLDGFDRYWETTADFNCRKRAARLAVAAAGKASIEVGGQLYICWTRRVSTGGSIPAIDWAAKYIPPNTSHVFDQPEAAGQPAPAVAPAAQPASPPQYTGRNPWEPAPTQAPQPAGTGSAAGRGEPPF